MSPAVRSRAAALDAVAAAAFDIARAAAVESAGDASAVGEALGVAVDGERLVTHRFAALLPAYRGWHWAVTVVRASRAKAVTVDEVVLLPGEGALLAPEWVPWHERVRAGDLGVGDLMVTAPDDERLVPTYASGDDPAEEVVAFELGLGRVRVLSLEGREDAADRWYTGPAGPDTPIAKAAPAPCATCGFWVPVRGGLGTLFGACANEYAPDDSRVVAANHGCGAHSEAVVEAEPLTRSDALIDTAGYDEVDEQGTTVVVGDAPDNPAADVPSLVTDDEPAEDLGHS